MIVALLLSQDIYKNDRMKNKLLPIIFFSLFIIAGCLQSKSQKELLNKNNTATDKLSNFPGTGIYILLPDGFIYNETAGGFVKDADGSVIKYDAFKKLRYDGNMPMDVNQGTVIKEESINISGYNGKIITHKEGETNFRYELSFGDDTFMEFIEATYFSRREQTGKYILAALETIVYKKKNN